MSTLRPRTVEVSRKNGSAGPIFIMSVQVVGSGHDSPAAADGIHGCFVTYQPSSLFCQSRGIANFASPTGPRNPDSLSPTQHTTGSARVVLMSLRPPSRTAVAGR